MTETIDLDAIAVIYDGDYLSSVPNTYKAFLELLRDNKDSLLAILNTLVYDPLVSFRLMVPYLMKMKEKEYRSIF